MSPEGLPSQFKNETDEAIVEVFARADETVLTTKEICEELSIGMKQTRRRLRDLKAREILGSRKTSQDIIWWLDDEVEEPITVKYPLLRLIRRRVDLQAILLGILLGFLGGLVILLYVVMLGFDVRPPLVSVRDVLLGGMYAVIFGIAGICGGLGSIVIDRVLSRLGFGSESTTPP